MAVETHYPVIVVGGGQAGLSMSYYLKQAGIAHRVLERERAMHAWRTQRWDSFSLVTPNWQCALPDYPYRGSAPHGFMVKDEILAYLDGFAAHVDAPIFEGIEVERMSRSERGGFELTTSRGRYSAEQVVVASGGYHTPIVPRMAERLPRTIMQLHSAQYRNAQALPDGNVLVVGCGQSGAQIAEDLHRAGRKVFLATGDAPRCARFYRGKDVVDWLAEMGYYDMPVEQHPLKEGVRDNTNHYVTGRDGGHDIDLRQFAREGMELFGRLEDFDGAALRFAPNLSSNLDHADAVYNGINASIDKYIAKAGLDAPPPSTYMPVWRPERERTELDPLAAGIGCIVWCIGFTPDFHWVDVPVFNGRGYPSHVRGVTSQSGLYFLGLPWLHTWGSGRFSGIARDARYLAERIVSMAKRRDPAELAS